MAKYPKAKTEAAQAAPRKYTKTKLRENCRQLFGVPASTFDGATHGLTGQFTVEEIKSRIETWEKEGVK